VTERKESPVDSEIERLQLSVRRIAKKSTFSNADVNFRDFPDVYDEYVRLAGNDLKHPAWNMGAKDFLDAVVSGKHAMSEVYQIYSDGPEGGKAAFIKNTVSEYRKLAQQEIMKDAANKYPEFARLIEDKQTKRQELKMPVLPGAARAIPGTAAPITLPPQ
jgi:hypothetical protein